MSTKGKRITDPRTKASSKAPKHGLISPAQLRAEGVLEVGCAVGSVLFVRTRVRVHLFRAPDLPDRDLDDYGAARAIHLLEEGFTAGDVTQRMGISFKTLALALATRGYERMALNDLGPRKGADARLREKHRRGRQLVRRNAVAFPTSRNNFVPAGAGRS